MEQTRSFCNPIFPLPRCGVWPPRGQALPVPNFQHTSFVPVANRNASFKSRPRSREGFQHCHAPPQKITIGTIPTAKPGLQHAQKITLGTIPTAKRGRASTPSCSTMDSRWTRPTAPARRRFTPQRASASRIARMELDCSNSASWDRFIRGRFIYNF